MSNPIPPPLSLYTSSTTLREVSNLSLDLKERLALARQQAAAAGSMPDSGRLSTGSNPSSARLSSGGPTSNGLPVGRPSLGARPSLTSSNPRSPQADRAHRNVPSRVSDIAQDIAETFLQREKTMVRDANYLSNHTEVTEKMRTILVDWMVDVHLKFKLHEETFFLAVDLVDRYLMTTKVPRLQLQLVGITCILLAAKYEEIWPPEVKDCIHVSANTYTRDDILRMERAVTAALQFKLTTPTPFPLIARLFEVTDADELTRNTAFFFLEHAVLDYKHLNFLPSQLANASMYLANLTLRRSDPWHYTLQHYSTSTFEEFRHCAAALLEFTRLTTDSKYQAIRRKYSSSRLG